MTSFYGRLQRYQTHTAREPLEDFLTEALADLLNRMPHNLARTLSGDWFLDPADRGAWLERTCNPGSMSWSTQVWIENHAYRLDLLASAGGRPLLVVEVKVSAGVQQHDEPLAAEAAAAATRTQLHTYGRWIAAAQTPWSRHDDGQGAWPGALAFLTHGTAAPDGFSDTAAPGYGGCRCRLARWSAVGVDLRRQAQSAAAQSDRVSGDPALRPAWIVLALEFCDFLMEKNMLAETMTSADLALVQLFASSDARMRRTFQVFLEVAKPFYSRYGVGNARACQFEGKDAIVWGWFAIEPFAPGENPWVGWGFRFPHPANRYFAGADPAIADTPSLFVGWGDQKGKQRLPPRASWSECRDRVELVVTKPLGEFVTDEPNARTEEMALWIGRKLAELETVLLAAKPDGTAWPRGTGAVAATT